MLAVQLSKGGRIALTNTGERVRRLRLGGHDDSLHLAARKWWPSAPERALELGLRAVTGAGEVMVALTSRPLRQHDRTAAEAWLIAPSQRRGLLVVP